jgi:hypothetical protein
MRELSGGNVVAHDDDAQANVRQAKQVLGKGVGRAHAAVRGRLARQRPGMTLCAA